MTQFPTPPEVPHMPGELQPSSPPLNSLDQGVAPEQAAYQQPYIQPQMQGQPIPSAPQVQDIFAPPAFQPQMQGQPHISSETLGGLIPVNNPKALLSYYIGIFSFIPLIGIVLGFAAVILGMQGLKFATQYPMVKGKTHAWVGIICGGLFGLFWLAVVILILVSMTVTSRSPSTY